MREIKEVLEELKAEIKYQKEFREFARNSQV